MLADEQLRFRLLSLAECAVPEANRPAQSHESIAVAPGTAVSAQTRPVDDLWQRPIPAYMSSC